MAVTELHLIREVASEVDSSAVDSKYQPRTIKLLPHQNRIVIGRNSLSRRPDYCLESALNRRMISRHHAVLERTSDGQFKLMDHSLNGTYVDYRRVDSVQGCLLRTGNVVTFGHLNGANVRSGQVVPQYTTDLKYRAEIMNTNVTTSSVTVPNSTIVPIAHITPNPSRESQSKRSSRATSSAFLTPTSSTPSSSTRKRCTISTKRPNKAGTKSKERQSLLMVNEVEECSASPCLKPLSEQGVVDWVQCDGCEVWFHQQCVGTTKEEVENMAEYKCAKCR